MVRIGTTYTYDATGRVITKIGRYLTVRLGPVVCSMPLGRGRAA